MNKLSIKRGLKFYNTLVLGIPTYSPFPTVESYRKTLSDIDLVSPSSESTALVPPRSGVLRAAARNGKTLYNGIGTRHGD